MVEYKTKGTCSRAIQFEIKDNVIVACRFIGGCMGNTQGVARLVEGMNVVNGGAYSGKFFSNHPIQLTAVPTGSGVFSAWEDGSTQNPRMVTPTATTSYSAVFK